ncbi:hypothetical protein [Thiolapillus sp.]|uniref:IS66 family transposase n=1 Tax=Thiolapillus sp. TaxID=2017437 RepID=UPI0027391CE3|nr:hypothetical protein [Thiolapillus sp.]
MQVTDCTVKNTSSGASDPEALFRTLQAAKTEIDTLRQQLCQARQQLDWFKRQLFGRKSEKRIIDNPHQLDLGELLGDTPVPAEPEPEEITYRRRKRTKQRSEDDVTDSGLRFGPEVPVEVIELSAPQLEGPAAEQYEVIDYKISHRLAQLPGSYVVMEYRRPILKHKPSARLMEVPAPSAVFEGSLADVSLLAGLLVDIPPAPVPPTPAAQGCWHHPEPFYSDELCPSAASSFSSPSMTPSGSISCKAECWPWMKRRSKPVARRRAR